MSWFEDQLQFREKKDNETFEESIDSIAGAVMGTKMRDALGGKEIASSAIDEILKFYYLKPKTGEIPSRIKTVDEQIEYRIRPFGIKSRKVTLDKGWYHHAAGAMLGTLKEDGSAVALIPGKIHGYKLIDVRTGKKTGLNRKTEKLIDNEAVCFYEPLPQKSLKIKDLLLFMLRQLNISDIVLILVLMGISTGLGLLAPLFTKWLMGDVLESGNVQVLIALAVFMVGFLISKLCFESFRSLINSRIGIKQNIAVQAAVMSRIMSLPPSFFREYSSGELSQRANYIESLCSTLFDTIGITSLSALFSLTYIGQIFVFAPALVAPALTITVITIVISLVTTLLRMKTTKRQMEIASKTSGLTYSTIMGIQKVKLAGAEKRMFSRWANLYAREARLTYNPPAFLKLNPTITLAVSLFGTLIIYAAAIESRVSVSDYYAFNTAYGMVSSAFMSLSSIAMTIATIRPALEMSRPVMEAEPEIHEGKESITELKGHIELSHISFRYGENMPYVLDNLSLNIKPGEYLAIAGPTGCGKSTLMRLILGLEIPEKGSIIFDGKEISGLDLESLRGKIGTVMQDGKLFNGDIYSNIVITSPGLSMDEAWEAAEISSVADDIRAMPMGMHTVISEGQGGISGGQKQRLLIARAVAPKPKILMFDEATSALDNITQKHVSDAIDSLDCTRIVIAHRLSTIQHADRIIYLESGRVMEEGKYDELIAKNGRFAELVERQRL